MRKKPQTEDRPVPHDSNAEVSVLGAVIRDARNLRKASRFVATGDFFSEEHRIVFQALSHLSGESKPTDDVSLISHLSDSDLLSKAGGAAYVAKLADGLYDKFDVTIPARRVHDLSVLRQIATRSNQVVEAALKPGANSRDVVTCGIASLRELLPHLGVNGSVEQGDGPEILEHLERFIRRFVFLSADQATILSLWTAHTHAFTCATATPYIAVSSAEKQSGKTRLLEVLDLLTANPWLTGRTSAAALVRKIAAESPVLLLDESDAAFGGEKEYAETLRGILNSGHRIGGKASLCVREGENFVVRDFPTFCPKAIAGLGKLPDTVADRSIPIVLKRAATGEIPERFRQRNIGAEASQVRDSLAQWAASIFEILDGADPFLPESLTDRQQDGAEPLLAIADAAGGDWPYKARNAFVSLFSGSDHAESNGTRLLADIRSIFEETEADKMSSQELADALVAIETSPWGDWRRGKGLNPSSLSKLLKPFRIGPHNIKLRTADGKDHVPKGYERADFEDAWSRYRSTALSGNATPLPTAKDAAVIQFSPATGQDTVAAVNKRDPATNGPRSGVAAFGEA
ncbi:MAG: DUF3631 domain-containing protein [Acidobacteriia bacterium]|nr:DUF3631 domain-containing protein [Terriglobia bacterium]